jgi:hypothetical protein
MGAVERSTSEQLAVSSCAVKSEEQLAVDTEHLSSEHVSSVRWSLRIAMHFFHLLTPVFRPLQS